MKTFRSVDDLHRSALASGAAVRVGEQQFNTERARVPSATAPRAAAVPSAPATPHESPVFHLRVAPELSAPVVHVHIGDALAEALSKFHPQAAPAPMAAPAPETPAKPKSFHLAVTRDDKGRIHHISATPLY